MSNKYAPVVVFGFNRVDLFGALMESLVECTGCSETDLYIFIDGPRTEKDREVQREFPKVVDKYSNCFSKVKLVINESNRGLRESIINGVNSVLETYSTVIVLEDDLIVSKNFLTYMNYSLSFYSNNSSVASISGYTNLIASDLKFDNYFHLRPCSWGWATWKEKWNSVNWNYRPSSLCEWITLWFKCWPVGQDIFRMFRGLVTRRNNSWAISWTINNIIHKKYTSYPYVSKVINQGFGINATHCTSENPFVTNYLNSDLNMFQLKQECETDRKVVNKFNSYFSNLYKLKFKLGFKHSNAQKGKK